MARVLFAIWPFVGHINPFVPVAHALRVHGHAVGFYTAASAAPVLAAEGFSVFPFDRVDERCGWTAVIQAESAAARGQASLGVWRAFRDWIAGTVTDQVEDLVPLAHHWKPDVIVAETAMWGPILVVWERLNIPVVVASTLLGCLIPSHGVPQRGWGLPTRGPLAPLFATSIRIATDLLTRGMRQRLNRVRSQYGLPALRSSVNEFL